MMDRPEILIISGTPHELAQLLTASGFEVRTTSGDPQALVQTEPPDLILLSLQLQAGHEVLRSLKRQESTRRIPVILLAESALEAELAQGFELGAADFLAMPVQPFEVMTRIRTQLSRAHLQDGLEAFREDESPSRSVFDTVAHGIVFHASDGRIIAANPAAERLLGLSLDQMQGRTSMDPRWQAIHEDGTPFPGEGHPAMVSLRTGQPVERVIVGIHHPLQEDTRWLEVSSVPIFHPGSSTPHQVYAHFKDITERKQAQEARHLVEARLEETFRISPLGMVLLDLEGHFFKVNPTFCAMLGLREDEFLASTFMDITHPEDIPTSVACVQDLVAGRCASFELEKRYLHKDGHIIWGKVHVALVRNDQGQPLHLMALAEDITERKQTESQLRFNETLYRTILATAHDGYWRVGHNRRLLDVNEAYCRMSGYTREELLGMCVSDLEMAHSPEEIEARVRKVMEQGHDQFETRHRCKDGRILELEISLSPCHLGEEGTVGFLRDISARKAVETQVARLVERLNQSQRVAQVGTWDWDLPANTMWWSEETYRIFETKPGLHTPSLKTNEAFYHPEDVESFAQKIDQALATGRPLVHTLRLRLPDGSSKTCQVRAEVQRNAAGSAIRMFGTFMDITAQKLVEMAFLEQKTMLRQILDTVPQSVFWKDRESRYLGCNLAFAKTLGLSDPEEILGKTDFDLLPSRSEAEIRRQEDREVIEQNCAKRHLLKSFTQAEGSLLWLDITKVPLADRSGKVLGILGTFEDITARRQAEAALRESEAWYRTVLQTSLDGYLVVDGEGRILETNQAYARMTGYPLDELLTLRVPDIEARDTEEVVTARIEMLRTRGWDRFETQHCSKDGRLIDVEVSVQLVPERNNRIVAFIRDISERKSSQIALRHSHDLMQYVISHDRSGIAVLDRNLRYVFVSERFLDEHRVKNRDVHGLCHYDVFPDLPQKWRDMHQRVLAGEVLRAEDDPFPREDGTTDWTRWECRPWHQPDGSIGGIILYTEVINEWKKAEAEHHRLEAQLQQSQKMESLGNLAGGIAHDLNNVLAAILGMATSVHERFQPPDPMAAVLETISKACIRGRDVVKSLLIFARRELGEEKPIDLNAVIRETTELLSHTTLKRVDLVLNLEEPLPELLGDSAALSHCLINLCVNAVDAMPGHGTITFQTQRHPGQGISVSIQDTGTGMSPEVLERAMEPFFTTKPKGQGTGLGLSMIYGAMRAHDGHMEIHSQPGEGTEVVLSFPESRLIATSVLAPGLDPSLQGSAALNILVVDDDDLVQATVSIMLEALGHQVSIVSSGEEALSALQQGLEVDLIILDMNMPGMTGAETLPHIRTLRPNQRVLLASGYSDGALEALVEGDPHTHLLYKPYELKEMVKALREFFWE